MASSDPLLVFGPLSTTYDFGPGHPLTPRRFAPSLDLLASLGATPGMAPEPVPDEELLRCHARSYLETVRAFSERPWGPPEAGIGDGDDPAFPGMHAAASMVAGGSIRAMEAILRGDVLHAFHPGGGLHHAMRDRASGFCIYNDVALAIARARADGFRVLYVDLDVHHGDGVQSIHDADPGVMTVSIHESGRTLFPGTGFLGEAGEGIAVGTKVNLPLEQSTGGAAWLSALEGVLPELAAAFGPDVVISQHGADSHAFDPLAHLRNTTTAMGDAARLVDAIAHRWAGGRWLATGGGGYDAYRVVPRSWSLVWLAGAHREAPPATPSAWRERWTPEATRYGQAPLPTTFDDPENAGLPVDGTQEIAERGAAEIARRARALHVPALVRVAADRGWWSALAAPRRPAGEGRTSRAAGTSARRTDGNGGPGAPGARGAASSDAHRGTPSIIRSVDAATWSRLRLAPRVVAPADVDDAHALIHRALLDGAGSPVVSAATVGDVVVGLVVSAVPVRGAAGSAHGGAGNGRAADGPPADGGDERQLLALGVGPTHRGRGLARDLLRVHLDELASPGHADLPVVAVVTFAERDRDAPVPAAVRSTIARRLLVGGGFRVEHPSGWLGRADPSAIVGRLAPRV